MSIEIVLITVSVSIATNIFMAFVSKAIRSNGSAHHAPNTAND